LVLAACRLYATRGRDVPFSTVAQEAGVGIATLYRHFPTQEALVAGMAEHIRDEVVGVCTRWLPVLESDPEPGWVGFVADMAALELGALLPQLVEDPHHLPRQLVDLRAQAAVALARVLDAARRHELVRAELTVEQFHLGLGVITRPLPHAATLVPDLTPWLVAVYLRGLRPR
jgi:AcrR family transcriptional regulator